MRILMIVPNFPGFVSMFNFPAGFGYLAAALRRAGHEVYGCNPNNDTVLGDTPELIRAHVTRALAESTPHLVCIGGLCTDYPFLRNIIPMLRDLAPQARIVMGGGIINHDAHFIFSQLHPDFCLIGEAEETLCQLVADLERGASTLTDIPNLGYWKDNEPCFTQRDDACCDINSLAFPDYAPFGIDELIEHYSCAAPYFYRYTRLRPRLMTLVSARGCPFSCTFCVHGHGPRYRARSLDNTFEEIRQVYERTEFNILVIVDELFAVNKGRLRGFCERVIDARKRRGWDFDWAFQTHARAALDVETVKLAKEAGCFQFSYGFESASPRVLASMNKRTTPEDFLNGIRVADKARVAFGGNLIFGDPAETPETMAESLAFLNSYCQDIIVQFGRVRPYPGSALFDQCLSKGIIRNKVEFYELMDNMPLNMTAMPDEVWFDWAKRVLAPLTLSPFVKAVAASEVEPDLAVGDEAQPTRGQKGHWLIHAQCPHCGYGLVFREMVESFSRTVEEGASLLTMCAGCHKRLRVTISPELGCEGALRAWVGEILSRAEAKSHKPRISDIEVGPMSDDEKHALQSLWNEAEASPALLAAVIRSADALEVPQPDEIEEPLLQQFEMGALASQVAQSGIDEIAVYGAGVVGQVLVRALHRRGVRVSVLADGNPDLHGMVVEGIEVQPLARLVGNGNRRWAVGSRRSGAAIVALLRSAFEPHPVEVFSTVNRPAGWWVNSEWLESEALEEWRVRVRRLFSEALRTRRVWEAVFLGFAFRRVVLLGANRGVYRLQTRSSAHTTVVELEQVVTRASGLG